MNVDYRKHCLNLVEEQLRENFEQRFLVTSFLDKAAAQSSFEGWTKSREIAYKKFMKAQVLKVSKEVYHQTIEEAMGKIMVDMASICMIFSDAEMKQIYELTKTPLGMKIIRNLDIMRTAVREGLFLMSSKMVEKWRSPENTKEVEDFLAAL